MATERNVVDFKIHNLTEEQFQELKAQGKIDPNAVYCTPDESLKTDQIANCITEIPQDIKLELNGGKLILKAGSKVYLATGDSSFPTHTIDSDIEHTSQYNGQYVVIRNNQTSLYFGSIESCTSGKIADRPTSTPNASGLYFATDENKMYLTGNSGKDWYPTSHMTLPIAIITVSNGAISSIDQVFNGFGYIGSTIFALPGVKGLIPKGRNEDGTLKNTEFTTGSVLTQTLTGGTFTRPVVLNAYALGFNAGAIYDNKTNTVSTGNYIIVSTGSAVGGKITSFEPKPVFHAVDYNDVVHKTGDETISGIKTFSNTIGTGAGTGIAIAGTDYSYTMRSAGATPNGCGLFLNNNASHPAFLATDTKITVGGGNIVPYTVTPPSSDNSTRIATTAWVNDATVHKTGDETVAGTKTFTAPYLQVTNAAGTGGSGIKLSDSNGKGSGELVQYYTGGNYYTRLVSRNATANKYAYIEIIASDDGNMRFSNANLNSMSAPTPASTSNGTDVATTAWVRDLFETLYPVGSLYITSTNTTTCPLASIVKKSDGSNSTWSLVSSGKALWTGTGSNGNTTIAAGLPNITGDTGIGFFNTGKQVSEAFYQKTGTATRTHPHDERNETSGLAFDASKSNTIYGNSTTVQPPAYVVNVWRRTA